MDINAPKKNQSLRNPSGRKPGGQRGHKGKTLEMISTPDTIVELRPDYCRGCGASLKNTALTNERSRQVVDIPNITLNKVSSQFGKLYITKNKRH